MTKPPIRISATDLDGYRWYKLLDSKTTEQYLAELKAPFRTNYKMQFGQAIHAIIQRDKSVIEHAPGYSWINDRHNPNEPESLSSIWIPRYLADVPRAYFSDIYHEITWEQKSVKLMDVFGHPVNLVAKVDGLHGNAIHELKTTERYDYSAYSEAIQKLVYMYVWESYCVHYTVIEYSDLQARNLLKKMQDSDFHAYGYPELTQCPDDSQILINGVLSSSSKEVRYLSRIEQFPQYAYAGMEDKIRELAGEFIDFIYQHGIETKYLQK